MRLDVRNAAFLVVAVLLGPALAQAQVREGTPGCVFCVLGGQTHDVQNGDVEMTGGDIWVNGNLDLGPNGSITADDATVHVQGTVNGMGVRAVLEPLGDGYGILLGPAWRRDCGIAAGDHVTVVLAPEGPQRDDLAPDIRAALDAEVDAGALFESLAQFYRNAYLRWIDATKRRPEVRSARIAEMIELLKAGEKQRPGT